MPPRDRPDPTTATLVAAAVGAAVTAAVLVVPSIHFAYRSPSAHLVLETLDACIASLVALLFYGRLRRTQGVQELLLVYALALLAACSLLFVIVPTLARSDAADALSTWAPLLLRLLGAALIAAAALVPGRRLTRTRPRRLDGLVLLALLGAVALGAHLLRGWLPVALDPSLTPERSSHPVLTGQAGVLVAQAVHAGLLIVACVAFTRQAHRSGDELFTWLGAAAALGAFSRVNYMLFPSIYSQWVYTGDFLRSAFYLLMLVGALREIAVYWQAQAQAATFSERRRLARDLHDGVVQELGYIRSQSRGIADEVRRARILGAAERALDEARWAISALSREDDETLGEAVSRAVREVADRYDVPARVDLDGVGDVAVGAQRHEALVRIVREAVSNAARHARASEIVVRLRPGQVVVNDDGCGFNFAAAQRSGGFGLTSMTERGAGVGVSVHVESSPGRGTEVRATW